MTQTKNTLGSQNFSHETPLQPYLNYTHNITGSGKENFTRKKHKKFVAFVSDAVGSKDLNLITNGQSN